MISMSSDGCPRFAIIAGRQVGKTRTVQAIARALAARGALVGGVVQPAVRARGRVVGYDLLDLASGERRGFARRTSPRVAGAPGFCFDEEALRWAARRIAAARASGGVVVVDELGRVEADEGSGHLPALLAPGPDPSAWLLGVRRDRASRLAQRLGGFHGTLDLPATAEGLEATVNAMMAVLGRNA